MIRKGKGKLNSQPPDSHVLIYGRRRRQPIYFRGSRRGERKEVKVKVWTLATAPLT